MGGLPREARDGIMRVWLEILSKKHPGVSWVPVERNLGKAAAGTVLQVARTVAGPDELAAAV